MEISIEKLIELIIKEVISELEKSGVKVIHNSGELTSPNKIQHVNGKHIEINMHDFKSPLLTENLLNSLNEGDSEILIPKGTVITPAAREIIKKRNIKIFIKQ